MKEHFLNVLRGGISAYPEGLTSYDTYNFTHVADGDEIAWAATVERLDKVHKEIRIELTFLTEEDYDQPKEDLPMGRWASGLIVHDVYHTGQIIILRKLQGSWPSIADTE